ncbi:MAG: hypothetical protein H6701_01310 [Myxococcales bacterium]|nr:hypothetical protein [Myxococcales bacterium]
MCAAGRRPVDGACLPVAECPGAGTELLDEAPALILGGRGEGVVCAPAAAVWRIERPAGCGAVARLVFDASRIDLDLELLDADGGVLRATASTGAEERLVLEADDAARYLRVRAFPADAAGESVYRVELWRDPQRCPGACAPPLRPDGAGGCVARGAPCAAGYRDGGNGVCVPLDRCALGFHDDGFGRCVAFDVCAPGALFGPDGRCRPEVDCAALNGDDGTGRCVLLGSCAEGYRDGGGGACVAPPACASGYVDDGERGCVRQGFGICAAGFEPNADGFCLAGACPEAPDGDDTLQSARPVDVDGVVRLDGAICGDDVDYYRVELFAGCAIEAHLRFDHDEGDLALGFIGPGGGLLGPIVDTGTDDEIGGHHAAVDGPVFVAVEPVGLRSARYRLDLRITCPE